MTSPRAITLLLSYSPSVSLFTNIISFGHTATLWHRHFVACLSSDCCLWVHLVSDVLSFCQVNRPNGLTAITYIDVWISRTWHILLYGVLIRGPNVLAHRCTVQSITDHYISCTKKNNISVARMIKIVIYPRCWSSTHTRSMDPLNTIWEWHTLPTSAQIPFGYILCLLSTSQTCCRRWIALIKFLPCVNKWHRKSRICAARNCILVYLYTMYTYFMQNCLRHICIVFVLLRYNRGQYSGTACMNSGHLVLIFAPLTILEEFYTFLVSEILPFTPPPKTFRRYAFGFKLLLSVTEC